jgi:ATP-dependent Clp protease protease subunit
MHKFHKLLASNKGRGSFRAEQGAEAATLYLYDAIVDTPEDAAWFGGIDPTTFIAALNSIDAPVIHLRVNSPGGSVFAARAMEQAIREHKAEIVVHVDGYAASAASFLIMAAKRVEMAAGAFLMIHKAWTFAAGNADDLKSMSDLLGKIDESLVTTYVARSELDPDHVRAAMAAETWYSAEEAVAAGLADAVFDNAPKATAWDLSIYENAPQAHQPAAEDADRRAHRDRAAALML